MRKSTRRICAAALACASTALANAAAAVDLRDWGRQFNTASERFVVLAQFNNEAVLDKETQLLWQRSKGPAMAWTTAVANCHASNAGGRAGWRLPSISELQSLTGSASVLPSGHPFQNITAQHWFWSSTDWSTTAAYVVNLSTGGFSTVTKTIAHSHLCVRGVGAADR